MSEIEAFHQTARDVMEQVQRQRRRTAITGTLIFMLAAGLIVMAVVTFVNHRADVARQEAVDQVTKDLADLCEDGVIDCRGQRGLPGPKAEPPARFVDIDCVRGRFVFTLSSGTSFRLGDCIAERGPRGVTGPRGPQGGFVSGSPPPSSPSGEARTGGQGGGSGKSEGKPGGKGKGKGKGKKGR